MDESDKTIALKKAYAEIILNTAKESAARVMVSDRKSARFHHDLCGTKEEALRLLVRLKQMIDAKTIEAEITSSNQQRQIDVLEAQLQEAEDIITDLRSELRWVRDKVEKARVNESQARIIVNKEEETFYDPEVAHGDSLLNQCSLHDEECGNDEKQFDGLSVDKGCDTREPELDVNIRNKKLELSRNGCTQRIHALESKVLVRESSPSSNEKDSEENLANGHETGTSGNTRCLVLALRSMNAEEITKPSNALGITKTSKSRRRKRRWGKRKATSVRSQNQVIKPCQSQSDLPCSKTSMEMHLSVESEEVDTIKTCKGLEEHLQHKRTLYTADIGIIRKGKRNKNLKNLSGISSPIDPTDRLVEACQESNLVATNVELKPLPHLDPELANATNRSTDKDRRSKEEDVIVKCEGEEDNVVPSTKTDSELVNLHSCPNVTPVVSDQIRESPRSNVNRLVKYTFQRKRKKGSVNKREVEEKESNTNPTIS